jgi:hypothetical protein
MCSSGRLPNICRQRIAYVLLFAASSLSVLPKERKLLALSRLHAALIDAHCTSGPCDAMYEWAM